MAGHSKWANIKHRKAAQDAKRGKIFTKLIREITVAARMGGGEPADNPRLRAAVDKALGQNMTRDTIDRAIKRGAGGDDDANMEEITYEGMYTTTATTSTPTAPAQAMTHDPNGIMIKWKKSKSVILILGILIFKSGGGRK